VLAAYDRRSRKQIGPILAGTVALTARKRRPKETEMSSTNLSVRRSYPLASRSADRAIGRALATIQTGAFLARAEDEARRNLTLARMSDLGVATRHALDEGDGIVSDLTGRIENNAFGAKALSGIAEDGVRGLRRELRRLSEDW